jgi:hypothetical protein
LLIPANFLLIPAKFLLIPANFLLIPAKFLLIPAELLLISAESLLISAGFRLQPARALPRNRGVLPATPQAVRPDRGTIVGRSRLEAAITAADKSAWPLLLARGGLRAVVRER